MTLGSSRGSRRRLHLLPVPPTPAARNVAYRLRRRTVYLDRHRTARRPGLGLEDACLARAERPAGLLQGSRQPGSLTGPQTLTATPGWATLITHPARPRWPPSSGLPCPSGDVTSDVPSPVPSRASQTHRSQPAAKHDRRAHAVHAPTRHHAQVRPRPSSCPSPPTARAVTGAPHRSHGGVSTTQSGGAPSPRAPWLSLCSAQGKQTPDRRGPGHTANPRGRSPWPVFAAESDGTGACGQVGAKASRLDRQELSTWSLLP